MNAFALLAKRKIANNTKNFKRAGIAFIPFLFKASMKFLNTVSFDLLVNLSKDMGLINCWIDLLLLARHSALRMERVIRSLDD